MNKIIIVCILMVISFGCCRSDEIPSLIQQLNSSKTRDRNEAALALAQCGRKAEHAVPRLAELLYDESVGVQSSAAYALRKIDTPAAQAIMREVEEKRRK